MAIAHWRYPSGQTIDALDPWEDVTELGHHLLDLPVEPRLGKAVLYSIVLKCLDPVLTIVCCLAHRSVGMASSALTGRIAGHGALYLFMWVVFVSCRLLLVFYQFQFLNSFMFGIVRPLAR